MFKWYITIDVSKIKKSTQCHITVTFDTISGNLITGVRMSLILQMKNILHFRKTCFFFQKRDSLRTRSCVEQFHAINVYHKYVCYTLCSSSLGNRTLCNTV